MELRELRLILGRHRVAFVVAFFLCVMAGAFFAYVPDKSYRTSSTLVLDVATAEEGASVPLVGFLLPALQEQAQSRSLRLAAADRVPEEFRRVPTRIEALTEASVMRIRGTSTSPRAAAAWVNAISEELVAERAEGSVISLELLDPAPVKPRPVSPQTQPIMFASVVIGLIAALFAALGIDRIRASFDTRQAVRERIGTTVLGEIPTLRRRSERNVPIIDLLDGPQTSADIAAAFEALRTNVEFCLGGHGAERLCVVSLERHAGKSTVAAGLACAMVKVGHRVVAVEADLRRPSLADQLATLSSYGLGDISRQGFDAIELDSTRMPGLELLAAGTPAGRAADVIATTLPPVVKYLADPGRRIVIDSPPLRGAPESSIVISEAKYVILVVRNGSSDVESVVEALDRITVAGGVLLGVVINRVPRRRLRKHAYPEYDHRMRPPVAGTRAEVMISELDQLEDRRPADHVN